MDKHTVSRMGTQTGMSAFLHALRLDLAAGSDALTAWISHIQRVGGVESLFDLEAWLRGLQAFSNVDNHPLGEFERAALISRNFSNEIRIFRMALQECEQCAVRLCFLGRDADIESLRHMETQIYRFGARNSQAGKMLEQYAPSESLAVLVESIQDLNVMLDALNDSAQQEYHTFVSLGRMLQRNVRYCRHVGMLLNQRFRVQFDRRDHPALRAALRLIPEESLRRNVSLALLHFYRNLRYLRMIGNALHEDRPLRRYLVIFALLHEQTGVLMDFIRSRFLKDKQGNARLRDAADLILHSLKMDLQRTFTQELPGLSAETDAAAIYARIENGHGLLLNCYQNNVTTMIQAVDGSLRGEAIFPEMLTGYQDGQTLRKDLLELRHDLNWELEREEGLELSRVLDRISKFRESSLRLLMYRDWGEFESLSEFLIMAGNEMEARVLLRKFMSFLEVLLQEVSKRSVLQNAGPGPRAHVGSALDD